MLGVVGLKALERPKAQAASTSQPGLPNTDQAKESNPGGYKMSWQQRRSGAPYSLGQGYLGQKQQRLGEPLGSRGVTEGRSKQAGHSKCGR